MEAEDAGFTSIWVMDHFRQIPTVGRGVARHARELHDPRVPRRADGTSALGALVTGMTYRNVAHLAKIVATLDVLSGGRAVCGLGAAWFAPSTSLRLAFPPVAQRYALLEDALELLR